MWTRRSDAVILRTRDHSESDRLVTFFSSVQGKLTGIAKGARRSKRRFVHTLEPLSLAPRGGTLLGTSRTVVDERATGYEFLQIRQQDDGVFFVARPSGQAEAAFRLVTAAAALSSEAVFENPTHDFPQRVIYRLQPDGSLLALEGTKDGAPLAVDFPMRRVTCR